MRSGGRRKSHQLPKDRKRWDYPQCTYALKKTGNDHPKNKFHFLNNPLDEILNLDSAEPGNPVDNCDIDEVG